MNWSGANSIFFLGIGGIGMSALARYFKAQGKTVSGYDRICSPLTEQLSREGMYIFYEDDPTKLPWPIDLAIYTPAVPLYLDLFEKIAAEGIPLRKRAEVLGMITAKEETIAIAGTHGKTTTAAILAHIFYQSKIGCTALIGGISNNYESNYFSTGKGPFIVEADEYDRSLLYLHPKIASINSMDADHLDVYEEVEALRETYNEFANQVTSKGFLVVQKGLEPMLFTPAKIFTASLTNGHANFFVNNIRIVEGYYCFDLFTPTGIISDITFGGCGLINITNAVTAMTIALIYGIDIKTIKDALKTFAGVHRRFEFRIRTPKLVLIDDYAHHPKEIQETLKSVKDLFPDKRITTIFQPHLYSRTRDFATEFAEALSISDSLILLDIYPAREEPIENVSSATILEQVSIENARIVAKENLIAEVIKSRPEVVVMLGAGDIDRLVGPMERALMELTL